MTKYELIGATIGHILFCTAGAYGIYSYTQSFGAAVFAYCLLAAVNALRGRSV